jgi:hypothetical protein
MLQVEEMKEIHMKFRSTMGTVAARREKEVELVLEILRDSRQQDTVDERVKRSVRRPPIDIFLKLPEIFLLNRKFKIN